MARVYFTSAGPSAMVVDVQKYDSTALVCNGGAIAALPAAAGARESISVYSSMIVGNRQSL